LWISWEIPPKPASHGGFWQGNIKPCWIAGHLF
jgi:hypothetical protein